MVRIMSDEDTYAYSGMVFVLLLKRRKIAIYLYLHRQYCEMRFLNSRVNRWLVHYKILNTNIYK